jgi:hypothetical protein
MLRSLLCSWLTVVWRLVFMGFSFLAIPRFALLVHRHAPVQVPQHPARVLLHERAWVLVCVWNPSHQTRLGSKAPVQEIAPPALPAHERRYGCIEPVPGRVRRGTQCTSTLLLAEARWVQIRAGTRATNKQEWRRRGIPLSRKTSYHRLYIHASSKIVVK